MNKTEQARRKRLAALMEADGFDRVTISKVVGISRPTILRVLGKKERKEKVNKTLRTYQKWDPLEIAIILVVRMASPSLRDAAATLGLSPGQVAGLWNRHREGKDFLAKYGIKLSLGEENE